jgi:uncharacterized membrane protein
LGKARLEAFSDGVLAIVITIMVLELVPPHGPTLEDLRPLVPVFSAYVLSFATLAIWWANHHHLFQAVRVVNGRVLWANILLLFWLSLVPFFTAWMGDTTFASLPVALYGVILVMASVAYFLLVRALIPIQPDTTLATAVGSDRKGRFSPLLYVAAVPIAFVAPFVSVGLYVLVAAIWIVPDTRIERAMPR